MNSQHRVNKKSGKVWVGFILLVIGIVLLINTLGFFMPDWIISWPMLILVIGLTIGLRHNFRHPASVILILIGGVFLLERIIPGLSFRNFIWPVAIIILGLYLIVGRKRFAPYRGRPENLDWDKRVSPEEEDKQANSHEEAPSTYHHTDRMPPSSEDYIDAVAIFGGVKKYIASKKFQGGEVVTIMGGAEINLTQADFTGTIVLDVVQVFGGTKIILPSNWKVSSEMVAIFGGIEDKRMPIGEQQDKLLIIKGTSIFGGVSVHSFA